MAEEIERKFLLSSDAWQTQEALATEKRIVQAYFTTNGGVTARVQAAGGEKRLVVERAQDDRSLPDVIVPLTPEAFDELLSVAAWDGVLTDLGSKFEARVRIKGDNRDAKATVTLKSKGGLVRTEYEMDVPLEVARELFGQCVGSVIEKYRYKVDLGVKTPDDKPLYAEIDIYVKENDGLRVVEVELPSADFPIPEMTWIGQEVTGLKQYCNASLALEPFSTWGCEKAHGSGLAG